MKFFTYLTFSLLIIISVDISSADPLANSLQCTPNVITPGTTFPRGDIFIEVGSDLDILCLINQTHPLAVDKNSSHLLFYNGSNPISSKYVSVINETTIRLHMTDVKKSKSFFYCKIKPPEGSETGVCFNSVIIDTKPQEVTNFKCVSQNWMNLSCTWKNPHHYVKTNYELKFKLPGRASKKSYFECPKSTVTSESCLWNLSTDPIYRQQNKEYLFYIQGSNKFGTWSRKDIEFLHFQHVIPSAPIMLQVFNKSAHSVSISWQPVFPMQTFPGGLVHKVEYKSMWDKNDDWKQVDTSSLAVLNNLEPNITIDNLKFAYTHYDVRVYMKSAKAKDDNLWSLPSNITFRTLATEPKNSPKTDIGSFQIEKSDQGKRDVYIYWQQLPEYEYNGGNFTYMITLVNPINNQEVLLKPHKQTGTFAKFNDLQDGQYKFKIYSINNKGKSGSSEIIVPAKENLLPEPLSFTKIAYEKHTYELSWIPPKRVDHFSMNYTLFWCASDRDRPYQCNGYLNWTHISGNTTAQNVTVPDDKIYQFAISINSATTSSGMVWSLCTVIHDRFSSRMNNVYIRNVGSSSITVAWQLGCSDRVGVIRGFIVFYCPVSFVPTECGGPEQNITIHDASATEVNVTPLRSYTVYKLSVAVLTTDGPGVPSHPVYNTTHASAPSKPPQIISVINITNTSANFIWQKPSVEERNGNIVSYEYCLNFTMCRTEHDIPGDLQNASVTQLDAYTEYRLVIRAFTNAWSEFSSGYIFMTNIGHPEKISDLKAEYINDTVTHISWDPPKKPAGPLNGYEIRINYFNGKFQDEYINEYCQEKNDNCSAIVKLKNPLQCEDHRRPTVQIRAYNLIAVNGKNTSLYGEWSKSDDLMCNNQPIGLIEIILFGLLFSIFFIPMLFYPGKKIYAMCKDCTGKGVLLPPGLNVEPQDTKSDFTSQAWIPSDYKDIKPPLPADEEYLIRPNRTPNRSESENNGEQLSLDSGDTQSSECHQTSSTSAASELELSSNASTPPVQSCQSHNLKVTLEKSAANLLDKINVAKPDMKPVKSNLSYVVIGTNNAIVQNNVRPHLVDSESIENSYNPLELEDSSLPSDLLSSLSKFNLSPSELLSDKLLSELRYSDPSDYHKFGELCHPMFQQSPSLQFSDSSNRVPSIKNLVIPTNPNTSCQTITTTTATNGYQTLPISSSFPSVNLSTEQKPSSPSLPTPTVSSIVINKGISGYVTVSSASMEPSHNLNCV